MSLKTLSCLLILIIVSCMHRCNEMKTIQLPLYHKEPGFKPDSDNSHNITIIDEHEAIRRGLSSYSKTMTNYMNLQCYTTLYIGEDQKEMTFAVDTSISMSWIPLNNCTG